MMIISKDGDENRGRRGAGPEMRTVSVRWAGEGLINERLSVN